MSERTTETLDGVPAGEEPEAPASRAVAVAAALAELPLVDVNYPEPTPLAVIVKDVARWSGLCFVMESSVNVKLQVFAPKKQPLPQAYDLFLAALAVAGLRTVQVGGVVKIVRPSLPVSA